MAKISTVSIVYGDNNNNETAYKRWACSPLFSLSTKTAICALVHSIISIAFIMSTMRVSVEK